MGSFKYTVLPTDAEPPDQKPSIILKVLKVCALCAFFGTIIFYKWPVNISMISDKTYLVTVGVDSYISAPSTVVSVTEESSVQSSTSSAKSDVVIGNSGPTTGVSITEESPVPISTISTSSSKSDADIGNYFVFTSGCRMPSLDPFTKDVLKIFKKTAYKKCDSLKDLVSLTYDEFDRRYKLHINDGNISCCYKSIIRSGSGAYADRKYKLLPCANFHQDFLVPQDLDAIITECRGSQDRKLLQQDAFSVVQFKVQKFNGSDVQDEKKPPRRKPSVLLWGIDSLSRMNFQRTMPLMHKYLRETHWNELEGYNKMGDNTYPNLLAILTGYNATRSVSVCSPKSVGGLDACPILWKTFKESGYITAYAEDWQKYATFNYNKKGFLKPPTDYYGRPLILGIEGELKKKFVSNIPYCVGRRHLAEYVYDSAVQFTRVYRNQSSFGIFWTNSFSHNDFALPSSMDSRLVDYMHELNRTGTFDNSIILFFSDHGMRFGKLRKLQSGFLEERMPILYIWLPPWFRKEYPQFSDNIEINKNRLTSPYDIHATLKHILELEKPQDELPKPEGCPSCHSVFFEVAESRDCQDAGIDEHWCTCSAFKEHISNDDTIQTVAEQLIAETNTFLSAKNLTKVCEILKLAKIKSVNKFDTIKNKLESYLVRYEAIPKMALFESFVTWNSTSRKIVVNVPDISRLDSYSMVSECVNDNIAKKFCICSK